MTVGPHLTTEGIAAAFEELLPERDQRAADAHLAACERCQAQLDELIRVRRTLHEAGSLTPPMPQAVQDRLEAVIANEALARQQAGGPVAHVAQRTSGSAASAHAPRGGRGSHRSKHVAPRSKPHSRKRSRSRGGSTRLLAMAASLVVLAVGSLVTYQVVFAGRSEQNVATQPSRTATASRPADLYYIAKPPEALTKQNFATGVDGAVKAEKAPDSAKTSPKFGIQGNLPIECAKKTVEAKGLQPLSAALTEFDGKPAYLVVAESETANSVVAYIVTGCPQGGKDIYHKTVAIRD